ncbi:hypothetical protein HG535_0H01980 [Zygotorulaspora mrakii]|uniref:Bromodomain associated domain-containing protein n=1 Tax=Zygotorulaspora mrakii TaxID=42260 RepID=A0A7H9B801_ZYGMR|nr:uncharacterized protein HG535_0H01980 [Zygotorulaspora mrakii]QLG74871.1 hypothetical protein HG535_0H01980 [Zygotorulaspora mrakii]
MTSNHDFYFGLLKVSIIQLLKSHGFERAKPSSVDTLTDLYIRYLGLLTAEIIKLAQARVGPSDTIALQDITIAFQNLGLIKPVDVLDVYDENPELPSDMGVRKFKDWCLNNPQEKGARIVAFPTGDLLRTTARTSKPLSLIPEYINQLQNDSNKEGSKENSEEEKLIEELINNGDVDDWIRLVIARQRINLAKRITGKEPRDIESLPSIAGLKHSVLEKQFQNSASLISNNQLLPTPANTPKEDLTPTLNRGIELMKMLPIMRPDCRIENVELSYDNIPDDVEVNEDMDDQIEDAVNGEQIEIPMDGNDYDDENHMGAFTLDPNMDTQFDELEDMNNTFQRRESLDLGEQQHSLRFNLNEF